MHTCINGLHACILPQQDDHQLGGEVPHVTECNYCTKCIVDHSPAPGSRSKRRSLVGERRTDFGTSSRGAEVSLTEEVLEELRCWDHCARSVERCLSVLISLLIDLRGRFKYESCHCTTDIILSKPRGGHPGDGTRAGLEALNGITPP